MTLHNIRIILVEPSHPGNIGSCARAMKNMAFSSLYLVSPKAFPHPMAVELSAGAEDLLNNATVVSSLKEALTGCQLVFMTSARVRAIELSCLTPASAASKIATVDPTQTVALVFGRERIGLTNAELLLGHYHIVIPANPLYASLNLAQAVQIIVYEVRMAVCSPQVLMSDQEEALAAHEAVELFYAHLEHVLIEIGFLKQAAPRRLMQRMRRLFGRIQLEKMEVDLLRGILSRMQYTVRSVDQAESGD